MLAQGLRPVLTNCCPDAEPVEKLADDYCLHDCGLGKRNELASDLRRRYTRKLMEILSSQTALGSDRLNDLGVALGESFANACRCAKPNRFDDEFVSVDAAIYPDRAILAISNSTDMTDWANADHIIPVYDNRTESGRGCNIIDMLVEESFYSEPQRRVLPRERFDLVLCLYYRDPSLS